MKVFRIQTKILILLCLFCTFLGCKEEERYNDVVSTDTTKPDPVRDVMVIAFAGGAEITYKLPNSKNLLYILAEYRINESAVRQSKASYYNNSIIVDGFEKSQEYDVVLYAVSRANVRSDSLVVKVHPETPPYLQTFPTLEIKEDFGGANIRARNPEKKAIGIIVVTDDETTGKMLPIEQYYTEMEDINFSVRGFDTLAHRFGVYITDRWGNISDTLVKTLHPIYETQLPKSRFNEYRLASDSPLGATGLGWNTSRLWDDVTTDPGWHTEAGFGKSLQICTFDMGVTSKLSRYKLWERGEAYGNDYSYGHGNPKTWTLWGSNNSTPKDVELPVTSNPGDQVGDWVNLGNFECPPPPSGNLPGQTTPLDLEAVNAGFEFNVPLDAPKVRFIRLAVKDTWGNADFAHVMEMTFWGDTR